MKNTLLVTLALVVAFSFLFCGIASVNGGSIPPIYQSGGKGAAWRQHTVQVHFYGPQTWVAPLNTVIAEYHSIKSDKAPTLVLTWKGDTNGCGTDPGGHIVICNADIPGHDAMTLLWPNGKRHIDARGVLMTLDPEAVPLSNGTYDLKLLRHELMHAITGVADCPPANFPCHTDSTVQGSFPGFGTWDTGYMDYAYNRWDRANPN